MIKLINNFGESWCKFMEIFKYFQSIFFNNFFSQGIIRIEDYEENYI